MIVVLTTTPPFGLRPLLDAAFRERFDDDDWEHGLGGVHVAVLDHDELVAHAAVVPRRIDAAGRTFAGAGYVENVATHPDRQARGAGSAAMAAIAEVLHERHELGVLSTSSHGFYERLGWERFRGRRRCGSPTARSSAPRTRTTGSWSCASGPASRSTSTARSSATPAPATTGSYDAARRWRPSATSRPLT